MRTWLVRLRPSARRGKGSSIQGLQVWVREGSVRAQGEQRAPRTVNGSSSVGVISILLPRMDHWKLLDQDLTFRKASEITNCSKPLNTQVRLELGGLNSQAPGCVTTVTGRKGLGKLDLCSLLLESD